MIGDDHGEIDARFEYRPQRRDIPRARSAWRSSPELCDCAGQYAAASIEAKTNTFYTLVGGKRADVGVVNGANGKYVRTYADGVWNDNLLALPECA